VDEKGDARNSLAQRNPGDIAAFSTDGLIEATRDTEAGARMLGEVANFLLRECLPPRLAKRRERTQPAALRWAEARPERGFMTQHVVIVDDEQVNLRLLSSVAREIADVIVHTFTSSREALVWCDGKEVDCFILGYHLPPPDGLETARLIRAKDALVPIVIVSTEPEREIRYRAFDVGVNEFVQKPVDARELRARLSTLLALVAERRRAALQIERLEGSLRVSEERSRHHAERLEAMWQLINNRSFSDVEMWLKMLNQAAEAIRPGQGFRGMLARIEGSDMIVEAIADAPERASLPDEGHTRIGRIVAVADTIFAGVLAAGGGTRSWDDIQVSDAATAHIRARGWRALIMTTFSAGGSVYVLSFASGEVTKSAFGLQDRTFIQILAAFFANHLQQRWQAERIQYQQSHDVLTGLLNRSQFRSQARIAAADSRRFGIVLIDVDHFHAVNARYGNMIGDALLVEVGSALRGRASAEEIVGRIGGNAFGIYLPNPQSKAFLRRRAAHFAEVFARPISTGDRAGKEFIALTASVGAAAAPQDGADIETILSRADAALLAAKRRGRGALLVYVPAMARSGSPAHSA
jgi:diguanylate cyclase (GGDEF)-like protein